ncbi:MAG: hypothetical protein K0Q56_2582 [Sporolactobacillus laevolacticus]|jgi:hypothetical protein|nr:hypothetical protein [Sporolactobacillus laevolacticus]
MKTINFRIIPILLGLSLLLSGCSSNLTAKDTVFHFIQHGIFLDDYQKVKANTTFSQDKVHSLSKTINQREKHEFGSKFTVFYVSKGNKENKKYELIFLLGVQQHIFMNVKKINGRWNIVGYSHTILETKQSVKLINSKKWRKEELIIYKP